MTTALRSFQPTQLRGVNRDLRTVDIVASDFSLDSYGTRIDPNGWDLEQFKKNPVICLQHDSYRALPVASALPESIRVENGKLLMTVQFPPQGTSQDADESFNLIAAGVLRGVSVGFNPEEYEDVEEQEGGYKKAVRIYKKQRLMEVSFVTIPSNDNGLVVRARELNADEAQIRATTEKLEGSLAKEEAFTLRIGERQIRLCVWQGDMTPFLQEFDKVVGYFERKKPANKASTAVLKKFFELKGEKQPDDEVAAWNRMEELIEPSVDTVTPETVTVTVPVEPAPVEQKVEETPPAPPQKIEEETTPQPVSAPAAPEPERTASVHVPIDFLQSLPESMTRALVDVGVAALQRGLPLQDALALIDGSQKAVSTSLSNQFNGSN